MTLEKLRDEAIKAFVEYGKEMKKAFNLKGDLLAAPLIDTLRIDDEEKIKEFIVEVKRQTAQFKAMINRLSS